MRSDSCSSLKIRTPEGIEFTLQLAGPLVRFLAVLIDAACIACATSVLRTVLQLFTIISLDFGMALMILASFLISVGYGIVLEWFWRGQTLGKRLLRLRVMDEQGLHLQFGQVVLRNLLRTVDAMPLLYLLGGAICFFSRRNQRLGDIAAGTIIVRTPEVFLSNLERLGDDKYNSLRDYPGLASRLRQRMSGEEASIALRAALRRDEMDPDARCELFTGLAEHFRYLVKFPADACEGVADERYVRNVLDIVYNAPKPERKRGGN
jgi:uncharacterized RDD family membrane protein YckC